MRELPVNVPAVAATSAGVMNGTPSVQTDDKYMPLLIPIAASVRLVGV